MIMCYIYYIMYFVFGHISGKLILKLIILYYIIIIVIWYYNDIDNIIYDILRRLIRETDVPLLSFTNLPL